MSQPQPDRDTRPTDARPVMGDHPELEAAEAPRAAPRRARDPVSPLAIAGIVALLIVVAIVVLLII